MQARGRFTTIDAEFETLRKELEQTNDLTLLKTLLIEHRAKLTVIEKSVPQGASCTELNTNLQARAAPIFFRRAPFS